MFRFLHVLPQFILPQHLLTSCMYRFTRIQNKTIKNFMIRQFIRLFSINMDDYVRKQPEEYIHFNDFFTRELTDEARPVSNNKIVSPVDGFISEHGTIHENKLIQAKGKSYTLERLLASNNSLVSTYKNGQFITLYLSPKNYHRIHSPVNAELQEVIYVPGKLFGVGKSTTETVNELYAKNERLILNFETDLGSMCLIMVGAIFVGSMQTVWHGEVTPTRQRTMRKLNLSDVQQTLSVNKGDEIGRFNMGSTVILLFENKAVTWLSNMEPGNAIEMGNGLADKRAI